jgi:signal transduction histidine kinase
MLKPALPANEIHRLKALEELSILDTLPEEELDNLTRLAAEICNTPIALITLIDSKRQWFKSKIGLAVDETPRDVAFCAHAIMNPDEIFTITDSRRDERFFDNPLVTGEPHVIFYSGVPLVDDSGNAFGTICVIDNKTNSLNEGQKEALKALAQQAIKLFELRKANIMLQKMQDELELQNKELEVFAARAAHDLKSPLHQIQQVVDYLIDQHSDSLNLEATELISYLKTSSIQLDNLINGILKHSRSQVSLKKEKEEIILPEFFKNIFNLISHSESVVFKYPQGQETVYANRSALEQVFLNLISNAIKYGDKDETLIEAGYKEGEDHYKFFVKDNGPGIGKENHEKIFEIFEVLKSEDRFGQPSTGIGLATVKKIVEGLGGKVWIESVPGNGTTFWFTVLKGG